MTTLTISSLQVSYGAFTLGPIDVTIGPGVTAVLGPNGSGKTTLLRAVNGLIPQATGSATADGVDLMHRQSRHMRDWIYVPDSDEMLLDEFTIDEFWSFYADVRAATFGDDPDELLTRAFALADRLALDPGRRRLREFSLGMRRKAQLITGVMSQPRLLMVDEPQNGLDFISSHEVRVIIAELREAGATIVMSNHDLDSVARMADHVIVVRDGKLVGRSETPFSDGAECERFVTGLFCDA
ncbi:MAG TPA: ABC transporter ATP-binding protein [Dermatophilaceae bacterium]|jgi:ABC-2 type transport system ATP-binding protein|nr:ABC transporter ATP-binding protein [Actinomycetales bacterium]HMT32558.1 ABC transporter ATP-binding protein [Dermatophilaceae bacterium]HMT88204.1 ABC transporter ATP-binding protein [Dermatophilaceae bacterium]